MTPAGTLPTNTGVNNGQRQTTHDNPPERLRISKPWEFGDCKRCLSHDTQAGDIIVRIYNRGWWHDACYRVVNPNFYEGMDAPA